MDKTEKLLKEKRHAFEALIDKKEKEFKKLSDFQEEQLESINKSKNLDSNDLIESPTEMQMREVRNQGETIEKIREDIDYLGQFTSFKKRERVEVGSLVKTSAGNFLVAVPELLFEANGNKYSGISAYSPLYEALEGCKEGESIEFNGQKYTIESIV